MFSDLIVAYLFLGGAGAGCCLVASILALCADADELEAALACRMRSAAAAPWRRFFAALHLASLATLLLGIICLAADLGRPDRLLIVLLQPAPTYIAFGAWAIISCMAASTICLLAWSGIATIPRRALLALSIVAAAASIAVIVYTGLLLSDMRSVPLWNIPWLVALFALSAVSCGIALALLAAFASRSMAAFASTLIRLAKADAVVIFAEALVGALCLASVWLAAGGAAGPADSTQAAALASLESLLTGPFAAIFWAGFALVGLVVPLVQDIIIGRSAHAVIPANRICARTLAMLGGAACVLVGGFLLRLLVVQAAVHPVALIS